MHSTDRTRGVALLVPRLLSIQIDPAEFDTAESVAEAIERAAEALLRWHDELAEIRTGAPVQDGFDTLGADQPGAHASPRLAERVREGQVPANPPSLSAAAAELLRIADAVRRTARDCVEPTVGARGVRIADALQRLATALSDLAQALRTESRRLADSTGGGPDQVLGRVVRAEHAARRIAAATLPD